MKLNFQRIFDNPLSKLSHFQKNFLDARNFLTIFLEFEYAHWVSTETPDPKLPDLNPTDVEGLALGTNLISRLTRLLLINIK